MVIETTARRMMIAGLAMLIGAAGLLSAPGCEADDADAPQSNGSDATPQNNNGNSANTRPQPQPAENRASVAPIRAEPSMIDFGEVGPNEDLSEDVVLHNDGDEPVRIAAATPTCQCTTVEMAGKEIPPGGSITMPVGLKTSAAPGRRPAQVKLAFHGYEETLTVGLTAEVTLAVRADPPYIDAVGAKPKTGQLVVESQDGEPFQICATDGRPPEFVDFDPETDEPRSRYTVRYDVSGYTQDSIPLYWIIETDHPEAPIVDVRLRHNWTRFQPQLPFQAFRGVFGEVVAGESGEFVIDIDGIAQHGGVESVTSASAKATTEIIEQTFTDEGMTTLRVRVTPREDVRGLLYFQAIFKVLHVEQEFDVIGRVVEYEGQGCELPVE